MSGKIEVCNMALAMIGEAPIVSMDQENNRARMCGLFFDAVRKQLLRSHDWNFASATAALALCTEKFTGWEYAYMYPGRCLFVRRVFSKGMPQIAVPFEEVNIGDPEKRFTSAKRICCDIYRAHMRYTVDVEITELSDPLFIRAFAAKLAEDIALPVTGKSELAQLANQKYMQAMDEARLVNKWEGKEVIKEISPILESR